MQEKVQEILNRMERDSKDPKQYDLTVVIRALVEILALQISVPRFTGYRPTGGVQNWGHG